MNVAKTAFARSKKFVKDHKIAVTVIVTATVTTGLMIAANRRVLKDTHEFIASKGLSEELGLWFYNGE